MKGRPRLRVAPCKYCNKEFKRQEHLERHIRTHTRERPFGCACGRTFSRLDLLNRHRRLSQCSGPPASIPQYTSSSGHEADPPPKIIYQISPTEPAVISPSFSNSSHGRTPPVSYSPDPGVAFVFDGANPEFANHTASTQNAIAEPATMMSNNPPTEYSQKQLMGKFSIHDLDMTGQDQQLSHLPGDSGITARGDGILDRTIETGSDFTQLQLFDINFLANETDMINGYLMDAFPPMDYQQPMIEDVSDSYSGSQSIPAPPDTSSLDVSNLMQIEMGSSSQSRAPTVQSVANQINQPQDTIGRSLDAIDDLVATNPWTVSAAAYEKLSAEVTKHIGVLPEPFTLPSRQTLSRYVASWMRSFHPHLPFIHMPTTCLEFKTPMLVLTLAATGSFYGFEHTHGYAMYFIAKSVITQELERRRRASTLHLLRTFPRYAGLPTGSPDAAAQACVTPQPATPGPVDIELLQSLLVLVLTMSWLDGPLAEDALAMSSQLTELTREALKCPVPEIEAGNWRAWAHEEERRRTLFSAYFVINILTICFNVPPQIASSEVNLPLPSSEAEFKAPNSNAWLSLRQKSTSNQLNFQHCLQQLLSGKPLAKEDSATEFGNYMLVQSLLVQVYFEHQAASAILNSSSNLPLATISLYENAYGAWQSCWDSAIESALDPSSPHGPLAFNSTAMLRLAHIHLAVGLQSQCALRSRDPKIVAQAFEPHQNPIPLRSPHLDQAVFHAICALRIPVRVGIAFVARGRTGHWSVQHAISNFACALLLTHWLENLFHLVSSDGLESLRHEEKRLLSIVERLIEETHLEGSLGSKDDYPRRIRRLAAAAVKLWAETCKGIQVFEIVHIVGETLSLVAESLENRLEP